MRVRGAVLASVAAIAAALNGCGGRPLGEGGNGGKGGTAGSKATAGRGGDSGAAGTSGGAGTSGNAGASGSGGADTGGTGGVGVNVGTAGSAGAGSVGAGTAGSASGGAGTSGGTAGTGGTGVGFGEPACLSTVVKGGACGPADQQFCYKTCGPERTGVKSETCTTAGTYAEMSGCTFDPSKDYSCYKIPTVANAACPAGVTPLGAALCDVPHCTLCNSLQGIVGGHYFDATGAPKVGWCTCQEPNSAGQRTWTCATDTAWPCPLGSSCDGVSGRGGSGGGAGGTTGAGGASAGGTGGSFGEPACLSTVVKGGSCGPADQQFCYKTCGPERTGVKTETCTTAGTYAEMSGCSFDPSKDYSCYKIPTAASAACPAGVTPMGSAPCDVPHCTLCNSLQGIVGGQYIDSTGAPKVGWCVCQEPNSNGLRTWSCANDTAWPCPLGWGC